MGVKVIKSFAYYLPDDSAGAPGKDVPKPDGLAALVGVRPTTGPQPHGGIPPVGKPTNNTDMPWHMGTIGASILASPMRRDDLVHSMLHGRSLCVINAHSDPGQSVQGVVNAIEHADSSGHKFKVTIGSTEVVITADDKPAIFGLNQKHLGVQVPYNSEAPSRKELFDSFLAGRPVTGKFSSAHGDFVLTGIVSRIEREDGSGHSFNVTIDGRLFCAKTRD